MSTFFLCACGSNVEVSDADFSLAEPAKIETTRMEASIDYLLADNNKTFSTNAYLPIAPVQASHIFEGRLTINGTPTFKQNYGTINDLPYQYHQWPKFSYEFIQDSGRLIPVDRGHGFIGDGAWSITAGVGAVWDEVGDNGYSRAAFPYTMKENNANCEVNGLATFLFKSDGSVSNVQIQNVAQTCIFYGFEFYGTLAAHFDNYAITNKAQIVLERDKEEAARIPTKPLTDLVKDYPSVEFSNYGYAIPPEKLNGYSILVNGISYVDGCNTRYGPHPYCSEKTIGIYSFTKTIHGFMIVAALEKKYPGFKKQLIKDLVPECSDTRWDGVTIEHALDMATGNYQSAAFEVDEGSAEIINNYFIPTTRKKRAEFACNGWPQQVPAGTYSVYHTTDTELLGYAAAKFINNELGGDAEAFNDVLIPLFDEIGLSHYIRGTQRTTDTMDAWAGYGLSATLNDIVRIGQYIRDESLNGDQLDTKMVEEVLTGHSMGLPSNTQNLHYDNGFWRLHVGKTTDMSACGSATQVPMLSGFGGHTSLLLPKVIITQMTDSGSLGITRTINDVFKNISDVCP